MSNAAQKWFPAGGPENPPENPRVPQLVCLPHAGAGAGAYREWPRRLGEAATVLPVQLPGREHRIAEPLLTDARAVVAALTDPALQVLRTPFVIFGHSMGALLAFELAHALTAHRRPPAHLVVSGCPAPQVRGLEPELSRLPDEGLAEYVRSLHGTDSVVLADRELMELVLPIVRADFAICDDYRFADRAPLRVPLTVLAGREDPTVPPESLRPWRSTTSGTTEFVTLPGGHFSLDDQIGAVQDVLAGIRPASTSTSASHR